MEIASAAECSHVRTGRPAGGTFKTPDARSLTTPADTIKRPRGHDNAPASTLNTPPATVNTHAATGYTPA